MVGSKAIPPYPRASKFENHLPPNPILDLGEGRDEGHVCRERIHSIGFIPDRLWLRQAQPPEDLISHTVIRCPYLSVVHACPLPEPVEGSIPRRRYFFIRIIPEHASHLPLNPILDLGEGRDGGHVCRERIHSIGFIPAGEWLRQAQPPEDLLSHTVVRFPNLNVVLACPLPKLVEGSIPRRRYFFIKIIPEQACHLPPNLILDLGEGRDGGYRHGDTNHLDSSELLVFLAFAVIRV
jgi:hypothetical protein